MIKITEVRVFPMNEDKLKAYVTITLEDCFVIRDLKVILGASGLFVAMPSKKRKDGSYKDIAHPLNNEFREEIEQKVLKAYEEEVKNPGSSQNEASNHKNEEVVYTPTNPLSTPPVEAKHPDQINPRDYAAPDD